MSEQNTLKARDQKGFNPNKELGSSVRNLLKDSTENNFMNQKDFQKDDPNMFNKFGENDDADQRIAPR